MTISTLNPQTASREILAEVHRIASRCHTEANPVEPYRSPADTAAFLCHPPASERRRYWIASDGTRVVGFGQLGVAYGSSVGEATIFVQPEARRHGFGRALFEQIAAGAIGQGCKTLVGTHAAAAGAAFAAALGAREARRDIRSVLRLSEANLSVEPIAGYTLRTWTGSAPGELIVSYAAAREAINDAPAASLDEWHAWDVDKVRDLEQTLSRRGRQIRVAVAIDSNSPHVVAHTELRVSPAAGSVATTEDTAVVRDHRGKGLAIWVKTAALESLRRDRPDVELVATTNAESNVSMLSINKRLGFTPVAVHTTCAIDLSQWNL